MVKVFIDSDVAFDIISIRNPFYKESSKVLSLLKDSKIELSISESCLSNIIYLSFDIEKLKNAKEQISTFVKACNIIACGKKGILQALDSEFKDKEDAVQYYTALRNDMDYFVTRNIKDYKQAIDSLPVITPQQLGELLSFDN